MKARLLIILAALILTGGFGWQTSHAQSAEGVYFPETGHWITGEFYIKYNSASNPLLIYGYPITDAFLKTNQTGEYFVQYFQKARFELHPNDPPEQRVRLTPLGEYLYEPGTFNSQPDNTLACGTSPETGFQVCYSFLDFFEEHGGLAQFGNPISNFEIQNDRIVQHFDLARFEWRPEFPPGKRVTLADLGIQYFYKIGENPFRLLPRDDGFIPEGIIELRVRAFPEKAVTEAKGWQTIYVTVKDQKFQPVANAQVVLDVLYPSGKEEHYIVAHPTNERGITNYPFEFESSSLGSVQVRVTVTYDDLEGRTTTSFRIWW